MSNELILLDQAFDESKPSLPGELDDGEQFEIFSLDTIFRGEDWSFPQIQSGIVDGEKDGGVDAIFLLVNGNLIEDQKQLPILSKGIEIQLHLFQSKKAAKFEESVIDRLYQHIEYFIDLGKSKSERATFLNSNALEKTELFHAAMKAYSSKPYKLSIDVTYACRGAKPTEQAKALARKIELKCKENFTNCNSNFRFFGAKELYDAFQAPKEIIRSIPTKDTIQAENDSYIALVSLPDYVDFISENDSLISSLFEFNVRDYEGDGTVVNTGIANTVQNFNDDEDFWWYNNGITILCEEAEHSSRKLRITSPKIVNGLQTSHVLFEQRGVVKNNLSDKSLIIKVVQTSDADLEEQLIKATNSQNSLKPLALKATENAQKKIEQFLLSNNIFYERRKNYYKNRGKPADQIVNVARLGQSIMAGSLMLPHEARARPGTYLKKDVNYGKVFPENASLKRYLIAAILEQKIDAFLRKNRKNFSSVYRNNLKYHLIMISALDIAGSQKIEIANLKLNKLDENRISDNFNWLISQFDNVSAEDKTAKDAAFTATLRAEWEKKPKGS